jgi:hypothetical protein
MLNLLNTINKVIEKSYRIDSGLKDKEDLETAIMGEDAFNMLQERITLKLKTAVIPETEEKHRSCVFTYFIADEEHIAMHFSENFKKKFEQNHPARHGINRVNFHLVRALIEEMDHYNLLVYSMQYQKPVSWIEAEMQADISEYLVMKLMFARQQGTFPRITPNVLMLSRKDCLI